MKEIIIKGRKIGEGHPAYIIAEMSANHAGSIERAIEIIWQAKACGADCVKIQTYTPDTMTIDCNNAYFHITEGTWKGENLYGLYQKAYTPWEWHARLMAEADKAGIDFFSTPFDRTSVDFLESIGMEFYKIASFELVDIPLIEYAAATGKPIIMSTGMGTKAEIEEAVQAVKRQDNHSLALLRCSSSYPAVSDSMNLATMKDMKESFAVPVGLSDHSCGSLGAVAAVSMGGSIIEKHFCMGREIDNPDASFSMEPQEFAQMVSDIRTAEKAIGKVHYGATLTEQVNLSFRRSIFVVEDVKAGDQFSELNIRVIRPSNGLAPKHLKEVLGRTALQDIKRGTPLAWHMMER